MKNLGWCALAFLAGLAVGYWVLRNETPTDTSNRITALADSLWEARLEALEASATAESLAVVAREAGTIRDSVGRLQAQLLRRPKPTAPAGTASDSVRYWEERSRNAEADLFDYQRLDAVEDSVQGLEVEAWRLAYETERDSKIELMRAAQATADSLRRIAPKVQQLEQAAGRVCFVGPSAGVTFLGGTKAALGVSVTCDAGRLTGKLLGAIF